MNLFKPNAQVSEREYLITSVVWVVVVLLLWTVFRPPMMPTPAKVLSAIGTLWTRGVLTEELMRSFTLNLKAISLSTLISLTISYLTVVPALRFPAAVISTWRFLGLTGLTLPFTLLFGGSIKLAILTFTMSTWFITSMSDVVADIRQEVYDHARTIGFSEWRTVWEVVVLGKAPQAFQVLRQNTAIGWMMLTAVEVISQSGGGIGLVLYKANRQYELMPHVFAILIVMITVGYLQDKVIAWLGRTVCPASVLKLERR